MENKNRIREFIGEPILNTTCFNEHKKCKKKCGFKDCKFWIESSGDLNCTIIAADEGTKNLQEIGDIFGVTRMRICQIEKNIVSKMKTKKMALEASKQ